MTERGSVYGLRQARTTMTGSEPEYSVCLRIHGPDVDPDVISEKLHIQCTCCGRRGEPHRRGELRKEGFWDYDLDSEAAPGEEFNSILRRLLERISAMDGLEGIREGAGAYVLCGVWFETPEANVHLDVDSIALAAKLRLPVHVSVYPQWHDMSVYK